MKKRNLLINIFICILFTGCIKEGKYRTKDITKTEIEQADNLFIQTHIPDAS